MMGDNYIIAGINKVYIIIVNFNTYHDTIECLESLLKSSYLNFQIFIVDNSPGDESTTELAGWVSTNNYTNIATGFKELVFPLANKPISHTITTETAFDTADAVFEDKITIIKAQNNGFAAANNVVLKYLRKTAEADAFIWLLNNDTVIPQNTLPSLVDFYRLGGYEKHIVGALLRNYDRPDTIQAVAGHYNVLLGKHHHIGEGEIDLGQYSNYQPGKNDYIVGASMFFPNLFLECVGLMSEDYFLYFEELDWINAGNKKGFSIAAVTDAVVYHKEGASITAGEGTRKDTTMAEYYSIVNRVRFIKKWYPYALLTVMPGVIFALAKRLLQGRFRLVAKTSGAILKILFTTGAPVIKY